MLNIIKPSIGGHDGSSFRELIDLWQENNFCKITMGPTQRSEGYKDDPDSPEAKCWIEEQGNILLYDFPILDRLKNEYNQCLFANTYKEGQNNKKWIFWPKHSRQYDKLKTDLRKSSKKFKSCFIGTPTNQSRNSLASYWQQFCDLWSMSGGLNYESYLKYCSNSRFGLCLPGVGPKCLRDIEYMGVGVIPIVVDRMAMDLYYNPPIENEHYLFAQSITELHVKLLPILDSPTKMKQMSEACIEWFEENCSIEGSFKTTMEIKID